MKHSHCDSQNMILNCNFMGQNHNLKFVTGNGDGGLGARHFDYAIIKLDLPKYAKSLRVDMCYKDVKESNHNPYEIHIVLFRVKFVGVGNEHMRYKIITMPCDVEKIESSIVPIFKGTYFGVERDYKNKISSPYDTVFPGEGYEIYTSLFDQIVRQNQHHRAAIKSCVDQFVWQIQVLTSENLGNLEGVNNYYNRKVRRKHETFLLNYVSKKTKPFIDRLESEMNDLSARAFELLKLHDAMNMEK